MPRNSRGIVIKLNTETLLEVIEYV